MLGELLIEILPVLVLVVQKEGFILMCLESHLSDQVFKSILDRGVRWEELADCALVDPVLLVQHLQPVQTSLAVALPWDGLITFT